MFLLGGLQREVESRSVAILTATNQVCVRLRTIFMGSMAVMLLLLSWVRLRTAYQKAVREQRMAAEVSAAKRDRDFFLSRVDKAKGVAAQEARKRKVRRTSSPLPPSAWHTVSTSPTTLPRRRRANAGWAVFNHLPVM